MIIAKICKKCGIEKPLEEFAKNKNSKDGHKSSCKICNNLESKIAYYSNLESERKRSRDYRRSDHGIEKSIEYYFSNQKEIIDEKHRFYQDNKEIISEKLKIKRAIDPEPFRQRSKNRKALKKSNGKGSLITVIQWNNLLKDNNYCCFYCKKHQDQCGKLTQDHIVPLSRGGYHTITNIVPACHSCNSSKGTKTIEEFLEYRNKIK